MKKTRLAMSLAWVFIGTSSILHAEDHSSAGKQKAAACVSCHGEHGNSSVPTFPKLAQQHSSYLQKQLHAFKNGTRHDPMMSPLVVNLSDEDIADISAYFATQKISANPVPVLTDTEDSNGKLLKTDADQAAAMQNLIAQGENLYRNGDLNRAVSACIACHEASGEGNKPAAFPVLRSQHAEYIIKTLEDFKSGARSNNPENIMRMIAQKMTDTEIKAVAYRISIMK